MQVWSLDREDPLEKSVAAPSSILAWKIPWTEEPGGLQSMGSQRTGQTECTHTQDKQKTKYQWDLVGVQCALQQDEQINAACGLDRQHSWVTTHCPNTVLQTTLTDLPEVDLKTKPT